MKHDNIADLTLMVQGWGETIQPRDEVTHLPSSFGTGAD